VVVLVVVGGGRLCMCLCCGAVCVALWSARAPLYACLPVQGMFPASFLLCMQQHSEF
jgi:hypothetical protein